MVAVGPALAGATNRMPHTVLLASLEAGGGHAALRDSFHAALSEADPGRKHFAPIRWDSTDRLIGRSYAFIVHRMTRLQKAVYAVGRYDWGTCLAAAALPRLTREARQALIALEPDLVISTHLILSLALLRARDQLGWPTPVVTGIPDYGEPLRAFFPGLRLLQPDALIAMDRETVSHLVKVSRISPARVHHGGFLPREPFRHIAAWMGSDPGRRLEHRMALAAEVWASTHGLPHLDLRRPTVILLGGSAWTARTAPVLDALRARVDLLSRLNVIVVCGRDPAYYERLRRTPDGQSNVAVFGAVTPRTMASLMALADVPVLGSLAPATMQELLELRCGPLLLHNIIPGTEEPHIPYIERNQVGVYEPRPRQMVELIAEVSALQPASGRMGSLLEVFPARAAAIREENRARAARLADFLDTVVAEP
jgi:processive 1,2-diacylglycerol beta-glucosyltransferase